MRFILLLIFSFFLIFPSYAYDEKIKLNRTNIDTVSKKETIKINLNKMLDLREIKKANKKYASTEHYVKETSRKMRDLMRLVVRKGTGRKADVPGYLIGGKTGTANKPTQGNYRGRRIISSFVAAFPMNKPRYVIMVLVDEPKGNRRTHGFATGGWVAAPVVGRVVRRMAPLLGIKPINKTEKLPKPGDDLFISAKKVGH